MSENAWRNYQLKKNSNSRNNTFVVSDSALSEIYNGNGYMAIDYISIPSTSEINVFFDVTGVPTDTTIELHNPNFSTFGGVVLIDWYTGADVVSNGTPLSTFNTNSDEFLTQTPKVVLRLNPTINSPGGKFGGIALQSSSSIGTSTFGQVSKSFIIGKTLKTYLKFRNTSNQAVELWYELFWIERPA